MIGQSVLCTMETVYIKLGKSGLRRPARPRGWIPLTRCATSSLSTPYTELMLNRPTVAVLTGLALAICYASTLRGMLQQWLTDDDMGHGIVVQAVILWILWRERARWRNLPAATSAWGWSILAAGAGVHLIGALG